MSTQEVPIAAFLKELMRRRKRLPSQLAADLGISRVTASRWLSGEDIPNTKSCRKLAAYSHTPLEQVLSLAGHMLRMAETKPPQWPEFVSRAVLPMAGDIRLPDLIHYAWQSLGERIH